MKINDEGTFLPMWGTCLGFERLVMYTNEDKQETLQHFGLKHESVALDFSTDPLMTKMFCDFDKSQIRDLSSKNITYNNH